jgi:hypothetical protein
LDPGHTRERPRCPEAARARLIALIAKDGVSPDAVSQAREILRIAQFEAVVLITVVADMVIKPAQADYLVLLIMTLAIAIAGIVFLRPMMSSVAARRPAS